MRTKAKKKLLLVTAAFFTGFLVVTIKLSYVMIAQAGKQDNRVWNCKCKSAD